MPDVLYSLSVFIRDLYALQKIDKNPNLGRVKVTLFAGVIRTTELDIGPVVPWTTLTLIWWMSPVNVITPLVFSETGEGYHVDLACVAINSI
jgi:hypothetical protein